MSDVLAATKHYILILACQIPHRTYSVLGYLAESAPLGGGADTALCLTHEREAVAKWAREQTKDFDEYFLSIFLQIFLKGHMSGQKSKSSLLALSATETGLIKAVNPHSANRPPKE